jgi:hypothetical protein
VKPTALLLLCLAAAPGGGPRLANLDFSQGNLAGWQGSGFSPVTIGAKGPQRATGVSSADAGTPGRKGVLRYVFAVPPGTGLIRFRAHAVLAEGCESDGRLNVVLLGAKSRALPKQVRSGPGWAPAKGLLPPLKGEPREYAWDVSACGGQTVQIALIDQDGRPGCHVVCTGFRLEQAGEAERQEFARHMQKLVHDHKLTPAKRLDSKHFTAWSNADADFTAERLRNCEALYDDFLTHFRRKGFALRPPAARLMVAVFDGQAGFDAYLGQKMPPSLVGIYHPGTNRLVIYDIHQNRGVVTGKENAKKVSEKIPFDLDRTQFLGEVERQARAFCEDANVSTTVHEAAHQLSFNCGLLSRAGDVPCWLAEGLATYCEPAHRGMWQGVGEPNYERVKALAAGLRGRGRIMTLKELVASDAWRKDGSTVLTGYAQSWALFRMLMEERPEALRAYLALIRDRRAAEHRLTDFCQAFGADLSPLERRHQEYVREMVQRFGPRQNP